MAHLRTPPSAPALREAAIILAALAVASIVAAAVQRQPSDFSALPAIAVVRDAGQRPLWTIRLAAAAHQIAIDATGDAVPPAGRAHQLWLEAPGGPHSLGLLPAAGRKIVAETPMILRRLTAAGGQLVVTLEPQRGSAAAAPSGPTLFHADVPPGSPGG